MRLSATEVIKILCKIHLTKHTSIWFQEEMRIGQRGAQTRIWARKGTRPRVVRQQQSESATIFGAVCAQRDDAVALVLPHADTQAMAHHLEAVSQAIPAGRHAVLVLDRAGSHTTSKLPRFPKVSLLPLPAGSPELNPAEQAWQQLRDRSLANRCYDSYEDIVDACCEAWNAFTHIPGTIRSLCTRSWARACSHYLSASTMSAKWMKAANITSSLSNREKMRRKPLRRRNSRSTSFLRLYISRS